MSEDGDCAATSGEADLLLNVVWPQLLAVQHTQDSDRVPDDAIGDDVGRFTDDQFSCVVDAIGAPELRVIG